MGLGVIWGLTNVCLILGTDGGCIIGGSWIRLEGPGYNSRGLDAIGKFRMQLYALDAAAGNTLFAKLIS